MTENDKAKQLVREALATIFDKAHCDEETVAKYVAKNFEHYVDGKVKYFDNLTVKMKEKQAQFNSMHITIKYILSEGNMVSTIHILDVIDKNLSKKSWVGHAIYFIENNKIVKCIELTHKLSTDEFERFN